MTEMQRRFCEEYIVLGSAAKAAVAAGYSDRRNGGRILKNPEVQNYLAKKIALNYSENIAKPDEILGFLSAVMRGELLDYSYVKKGGELVTVKREPTLKERVAAAALLGKRYGLFTERVCLEEASRVVISEVDIPE